MKQSSAASFSDDFHQSFTFFEGKGAPFSRFEITKDDRANGEANKALHAVSDSLDHVADLALFTGREDHREAARREAFDLISFGFADFGEDAFFKLRNDAVFESMLHGDVVELFDLVLRMGERLSEFAIVTEEEETFGFEIETTDVHEILQTTGQEGVDGRSIVLVIPSADESCRFMENDGLDSELLEAFSGGADLILRLNAVGWLEADFAIDEDFAL